MLARLLGLTCRCLCWFGIHRWRRVTQFILSPVNESGWIAKPNRDDDQCTRCGKCRPHYHEFTSCL